MNSALLTVGIALVCALVAALIAPFFIDWGGYRDFFETRASRMLGTPVRIEGALSARLLPRPLVVASNVTFGEEGGLRARDLTLRVGLTPLMTGNLQVEQIRLEGLDATLRLGDDGQIAGIRRPDMQTDTDAVTLEDIQIVDGRVTVIDAAGGTQVFDAVNLNASAGNLDGPYKAEGSAAHGGDTFDIVLASGRWGEAGDLRARTSITPRGRPVTFDADGLLRIDEGVPAFNGRLRLERVADENAPGSRWLFRGDADANAARVRFSALNLGFGPADRQFTLEGAGTLNLGPAPRFEVVLGARQADLDRAIGTGDVAQASLADVLSRVGSLSRIPPPIPGRIGLDLERVVVGGNLVDDVSLSVLWDGASWAVEQASAALPGDTQIGIAGDLAPASRDGDSLRFSGAVRMATQRGGAFADWLGPELRPYTGWLNGTIDGRADINMDAERIALDDISMSLDGRPVNGRVAYDLPRVGDSGEVTIALEGQEIRIEALQALWAGMRSANAQADADLPDISLQLTAQTLAAVGVDAREVAIDASLAGGELDLRKLEIGNLGGARMSARGTLGVAGEGQDGVLDFSLDAQALDGAAKLLGVLGQDMFAGMLEIRARVLAPLSLTGQLRTGVVAGGRTALTLDGTAAGTTLAATGSIGGALAQLASGDIDAQINLSSDDAAGLVQQLGLPVATRVETGPGTLDLKLQGVPRDGIDIDASADVFETRLGARGNVRIDADGSQTLDLGFEADSAALVGFLSAFDLVAPRLGEAAVPARVTGRIGGRDPFALSDLSLGIGPVSQPSEMRGQGTLSLGSGTRPHRIDAEMTGDQVSLPGVLDALFGTDRFIVADDGASAFSARPFAVTLPDRVEVNASLSVDRLSLAPVFTLTDASADLAIRSDGLRLDRFEGEVFGGAARGALRLTARSGNVSADGRLRLEDARLEDIAWLRSGRPVASGTLSSDLTFAGNGRSLSAIVSSLTGEGAARVANGSITGMSPVAFDRIVEVADRGTEIDAERARELLGAYLDQGVLDFDSADMTFSIAGGVARATRFSIDGDGLQSFVTGQADLNAMRLNSAWSVRAPPDRDAPDQVREFGIVFNGPLTDPVRSFDVAPLIGYLTIRAFEREVDRLEELQLDIHDRGRIQRELDVLVNRRFEARQAAEARERRARRARQAAERRAREEADRKAAQEAAEAAAAAAATGAAQNQPLLLPAPGTALGQPIDVAPPPGLVLPDDGQFPQDSRDPQLPGNAIPQEQLPGVIDPQTAGTEPTELLPPLTPTPAPRSLRIDPLAGGSDR